MSIGVFLRGLHESVAVVEKHRREVHRNMRQANGRGSSYVTVRGKERAKSSLGKEVNT
jgi:hypothetical protein